MKYIALQLGLYDGYACVRIDGRNDILDHRFNVAKLTF